jgi:hypothetical protein
MYEQLRPYYEQKLRDAKGDIELAKKYILEDYKTGKRYREEDLKMMKGDVELASKRLQEDYQISTKQAREDYQAALTSENINTEEGQRALIGLLNDRGILLGQLPGGSGDINQSAAPVSDYAARWHLDPYQQKADLRKQAIEKAYERTTGSAGLIKKRGEQDVANQFSKFKVGQKRSEEEAFTGKERGLTQQDRDWIQQEQDLLELWKDKAYTHYTPLKYQEEAAKYRAINKLGA